MYCIDPVVEFKCCPALVLTMWPGFMYFTFIIWEITKNTPNYIRFFTKNYFNCERKCQSSYNSGTAVNVVKLQIVLTV